MEREPQHTLYLECIGVFHKIYLMIMSATVNPFVPTAVLLLCYCCATAGCVCLRCYLVSSLHMCTSSHSVIPEITSKWIVVESRQKVTNQFLFLNLLGLALLPRLQRAMWCCSGHGIPENIEDTVIISHIIKSTQTQDEVADKAKKNGYSLAPSRFKLYWGEERNIITIHVLQRTRDMHCGCVRKYVTADCVASVTIA